MVTNKAGRLAEIKAYFDNGDIHVGYRRLLDAAIETQDMEVYEQTLRFCDWYDAASEHKHPDAPVLAEQVNTLVEKIDKIPDYTPQATGKPRLSANNITKKYHRGFFSLSAVDMELYPGRIIGLVGENGNGKTTLLRLLYGELLPDSGSINYYLENIPQTSSFYNIKTRLAFIPQRQPVWYGSLFSNLQFAGTHYGWKGKENYLWTEMIIARMGLRPFRAFTWSRISSGYKMRFELARALLKKPEVLLLDEPLANLDVLAQQVILEDLKFLAGSSRMPLGIILSSQQLYEVEKVSEQVIFLKQGKAQYQQTRQAPEIQAPSQLILELETTVSRETLQEVFEPAGLQRISFNGGIYILYFAEGTGSPDILRKLGETGLPVNYFRDISSSSRRFFDA
jgi:ABC-2 type transport system ATP-binding protein